MLVRVGFGLVADGPVGRGVVQPAHAPLPVLPQACPESRRRRDRRVVQVEAQPAARPHLGRWLGVAAITLYPFVLLREAEPGPALAACNSRKTLSQPAADSPAGMPYN